MASKPNQKQIQGHPSAPKEGMIYLDPREKTGFPSKPKDDMIYLDPREKQGFGTPIDKFRIMPVLETPAPAQGVQQGHPSPVQDEVSFEDWLRNKPTLPTPKPPQAAAPSDHAALPEPKKEWSIVAGRGAVDLNGVSLTPEQVDQKQVDFEEQTKEYYRSRDQLMAGQLDSLKNGMPTLDLNLDEVNGATDAGFQSAQDAIAAGQAQGQEALGALEGFSYEEQEFQDLSSGLVKAGQDAISAVTGNSQQAQDLINQVSGRAYQGMDAATRQAKQAIDAFNGVVTMPNLDEFAASVAGILQTVEVPGAYIEKPFPFELSDFTGMFEKQFTQFRSTYEQGQALVAERTLKEARGQVGRSRDSRTWAGAAFLNNVRNQVTQTYAQGLAQINDSYAKNMQGAFVQFATMRTDWDKYQDNMSLQTDTLRLDAQFKKAGMAFEGKKIMLSMQDAGLQRNLAKATTAAELRTDMIKNMAQMSTQLSTTQMQLGSDLLARKGEQMSKLIMDTASNVSSTNLEQQKLSLQQNLQAAGLRADVAKSMASLGMDLALRPAEMSAQAYTERAKMAQDLALKSAEIEFNGSMQMAQIQATYVAQMAGISSDDWKAQLNALTSVQTATIQVRAQMEEARSQLQLQYAQLDQQWDTSLMNAALDKEKIDVNQEQFKADLAFRQSDAGFQQEIEKSKLNQSERAMAQEWDRTMLSAGIDREKMAQELGMSRLDLAFRYSSLEQEKGLAEAQMLMQKDKNNADQKNTEFQLALEGSKLTLQEKSLTQEWNKAMMQMGIDRDTLAQNLGISRMELSYKYAALEQEQGIEIAKLALEQDKLKYQYPYAAGGTTVLGSVSGTAPRQVKDTLGGTVNVVGTKAG